MEEETKVKKDKKETKIKKNKKSKKETKKRPLTKMEICIKIMAAILVILMIFATAASLIFALI